MRKDALLAAAAVAAGLSLATPAVAAPKPDVPTCRPAATAVTSVDEPVTVRVACDGAARLRVTDPPLHGTIDRVDARAGTLRYTPSPRWHSPDADRFRLVAETRGGADRVRARVTVQPDAPRCRDLARTLTVRGHSAFRLPCGDLRSAPRFEIVDGPDHGRARIVQATGRLVYAAARPRAARRDALTYRVSTAGGASGTHTAVLRPAVLRPAVQAAARQAPAPPAPAPTTPTTTPAAPTPPTTPGTPSTPAKPAAAAPVCAPVSAETGYGDPVAITVSCTGEDITLVLTTQPVHGELSNVQVKGGTLTATYTPASGYDRRVGDESFTFQAANAGGLTTATVKVTVDPFRFVAFGDSVTAGFGYYADGSEMTGWQFWPGGCKPGDLVAGQCSSNSTLDRGVAAGAAPSYAADFGLGNNVSWAAQFANAIPGGVSASAGMYQNLAVTGSSPADWLALPADPQDTTQSFPDGSGALTPTLDKLLAGDPDLVAFTLGANPVLTEMVNPVAGQAINCRWLNTNAGWTSPSPIFTWNQSLNCIQPHLGEGALNVQNHLEALYGYLLTHSDDTTFVVMPYHLPVPNLLSAGWGWWQLEGAIDLLNQAIDQAVANVRAQYPAQAGRLLHVTAQVDPNKADPTQLARFNMGGWSTRLGSPACVPANTACQSGDANDYGWSANYSCSWIWHDVDGPSHQSLVLQLNDSGLTDPITCPGQPWIISSDQGIHPNTAGYAQFAAALQNHLTANGRMPVLPKVG